LTYPNVLVLDYLKSTNQSTPELEMKAEEYINLGYQRLVVFEVDGGGFSLYGDPPARLFLSAYGLMEISDMAEVYPVDEAMIERTARWLVRQQADDGSWSSDDYRVAGQQLATTAYVTLRHLGPGRVRPCR
jgi:squalene cyclase